MKKSIMRGMLRAEHRLSRATIGESLRAFRGAHGHEGAARRPTPGSQPYEMAIRADAIAPQIEWHRFTSETIEERRIEAIEELRPALGGDTVDWIHVTGFGGEEQLRALGELFGIHPLALADTVNVPQRAKVDLYDDQELIILRMARNAEREIDIQQLSIVVCVRQGWVVSFVEHAGDVFDPIRTRLRMSGTVIRRSGADFFAYALIDAVVDGFFPVVDNLSEMLDELEEAAIADPQPRTLARIHAFRRLLIKLARTQRQQRDAVLMLSRQEEGTFGESVRPYLRDVEDHAIHVLDSIETLREMSVSVMDIYLSSVSNRMNEVMKTLTIMASLFIPLTFIVGVYGMNFEFMPELRWRWGYVGIWGVMLVVAFGLLAWFRWRGWLGTTRRRTEDDESL